MLGRGVDMSLLSIYEEYVQANKEYVDFIDKIINDDFSSYTEDEINKKLVVYKDYFEKLRDNIEKTDITNEADENVKDLKYLLVDVLFLAIDLYNFYNAKEIERFKMRGINYIRKRRVADFFK